MSGSTSVSAVTRVRIPLFAKLMGGFLLLALLNVGANLWILSAYRGAVARYREVIARGDRAVLLAHQIDADAGDKARSL
ncbi:MAG: hypothetical protein IRZ26_08005, partial [Clostridia bacterium]|nr:hypothetical protein [Clostridia bacterium]